MILIAGDDQPVAVSTWPQLAKSIYEQKRKSPVAYQYQSVSHLQFEMLLRVKLVEAAAALNRSGAKFTTFAKSRCNARFWHLKSDGGFSLKLAVTAAEGIRDIFVNGYKYAFECSTAIVIVLYKAVLDSIEEHEFNRLFADLLLYDWHYDDDLRLIQEQGSAGAYSGDILYFKNPDVNPETPEWQGENVVKMGKDLYYGHGIGIQSAQGMIAKLNRHRKPGSHTPAYLTDLVIYPDFLYLSQFAPGGTRVNQSALERFGSREEAILTRIGGQRFISN